MGNTERYTKLTLRSSYPLSTSPIIQILLREYEEHVLRCITKNQRISTLQQSQVGVWAIGRACYPEVSRHRKAGLSKESEAMPIGSLLLEKQRKLRLNCEPLCRHLPWLGWIKIKRTIYTACVLLKFLLFWLWPGLSSHKTVCKGRSKRIWNPSEMSPC